MTLILTPNKYSVFNIGANFKIDMFMDDRDNASEMCQWDTQYVYIYI